MQHETIYGCIQEIQSFSQPSLLQDAGDKLTQQVQEYWPCGVMLKMRLPKMIP
jgi:hypothetical protein